VELGNTSHDICRGSCSRKRRGGEGGGNRREAGKRGAGRVNGEGEEGETTRG
jgi:hypothetical protein